MLTMIMRGLADVVTMDTILVECVSSMLVFANQHLTQSTTKVQGNVMSYAGINAHKTFPFAVKIIMEIKKHNCVENIFGLWDILNNLQLQQALGSQRCASLFTAPFPLCFEFRFCSFCIRSVLYSQRFIFAASRLSSAFSKRCASFKLYRGRGSGVFFH